MGARTDAAAGRIGRYEILAELGQGAMGIVYQARDPQLDRIVAIKTVRPDLGLPPEEYADLKQRFHQEAMAAGRFNHPNIVAIYDVVEADGTPHMVMEYFAGRTLADLIAVGSLSPHEAVHVVLSVCDALDYVHAQGVVHRDIKTRNILVAENGLAKLSDFGIARIAGRNLTHTGVMLGTPAYMAPEQVRGRAADARSDLFALGVVLYETLTGVHPFHGDDLAAILYQIAHDDPLPARTRNPAIPPALDAVLTRVMSKEPEQRYPSARAFADALAQASQQALGFPGPPKPGLSLPRLAGGRRRSVVIAAGCLLIAGATYSAVPFFRPAPEFGEVVAVIRQARTEKPVPDAKVEILTPEDALVTTVTPADDGKARYTLRGGPYRLRVSHPRFGAEVRQIKVLPGQTAEIRVELTRRGGGSAPVAEAATRAVNEGVDTVRRFFRDLGF